MLYLDSDSRCRSAPHLYGHMQEVSVIQGGLDGAVLVTAAAHVRMRGTHDEELVEVSLGQELEQHADRLLLGHHSQETHHVRVLELRQHRGFLWGGGHKKMGKRWVQKLTPGAQGHRSPSGTRSTAGCWRRPSGF